ncbi:MAG: UDP-N-acetylmuramoyl-L-alanyl-D-glutamate--2,6-diaminopimelate ligase [Rhodanobacteraceae bacterium]|nr:UDP-N-acetylmuramoyl-L-alanyl-D-glutamate--2,6-diaminopimelate ligase [Rhodanobacteraceae bacterium]
MTSALMLDELLRQVGLDGVAGIAAGGAQLPVSGIALDTRELRAGDVFLALRGGSDHGLRHAPAAVAAGAVAILAELPMPDAAAVDVGAPVLPVADLRSYAGVLADRVYGSPSHAMDVIGVTGTNGKTSTVQFIAQAAARLDRRPATQGTLGAGPVGALRAGQRTTPDVCSTQRFLGEMRAAGCDLVAMEVSSHALDQGRVDSVRFDVAVFTQLSRDHLDYHGSMTAYFEAKTRLFQWPGLRAAVINIDCPWGRKLLTRTHAPVISTSANGAGDAMLAAEDIVLDHAGLRFTLRLGGQRHAVATGLIGRFNIDNLLAACGALHALGADLAQLAAVLPQLQPVPGRMNRLGGADQPLVVVDYAHTPDAIAKALAALREHAPRQLSIVFGCGGERDRGKRPQMAAAAEAGADRVLVTDDNPRGEDGDAIVAEIVAGFERPQAVIVERDRRSAIELALAAASSGDIVLIAGKGHEPYQEVGGRQLPFDDRVVAEQCLLRRAA